MAMDVRVGCCGFPMAKADYYRYFPVVEIQQTFYNLPRIQTAGRWREEAMTARALAGHRASGALVRLRPDRDGLARAQGRRGAAARQRDDEGARAFEGSGPCLPLTRA